MYDFYFLSHGRYAFLNRLNSSEMTGNYTLV